MPKASQVCGRLKGRSDDIPLQHAGPELDKTIAQLKRPRAGLFGTVKS